MSGVENANGRLIGCVENVNGPLKELRNRAKGSPRWFDFFEALTLQGCEIGALAAENFPFRRKGLLRTSLKTSKRGVYRG
jgi:hypothetical protein